MKVKCESQNKSVLTGKKELSSWLLPRPNSNDASYHEKNLTRSLCSFSFFRHWHLTLGLGIPYSGRHLKKRENGKKRQAKSKEGKESLVDHTASTVYCS